MSKHVKTLFPTYIYQAPLAPGVSGTRLRKDILKETYQFQAIDDVGLEWSKENYWGGYTSYSSFSQLAEMSSTFTDFKKLLDRHVKSFCQKLELDLKGRPLKLSSCWINIMGEGCHHSFHLHPLSAISGTYYVQVPTGADRFRLEDPRPCALMAAPPKKPNARAQDRPYVTLRPAAGEIILFESWMKHDVPPNPSSKDRVSISFNYDWV
jgi:uncharacterized protein (TIGR02466 family)